MRFLKQPGLFPGFAQKAESGGAALMSGREGSCLCKVQRTSSQSGVKDVKVVPERGP